MAGATPLAQRTCKPCEGGAEPLPVSAAQVLLQELKGWELIEGGNAIRKMVKFAGFEVLRVETQGLGRHFLSSWRSSRVSGRIEASYAGSSHRPPVLFVERIVNAVLNLVQAGQVISVYARRRSVSSEASPPLPAHAAPPRLRRGRRRRGLWDMGA